MLWYLSRPSRPPAAEAPATAEKAAFRVRRSREAPDPGNKASKAYEAAQDQDIDVATPSDDSLAEPRRTMTHRRATGARRAASRSRAGERDRRLLAIADAAADRRRSRHTAARQDGEGQHAGARGRRDHRRAAGAGRSRRRRPRRCRSTSLYQDADVIVVNKPAGMVVHPGAGHDGGTLVNALLHHVTDLSGIGGELRPGIVHRLDKGTSGVMVVAKHDAAHQELARQFHDREVEKEYVALVWGLVQQRKRIDMPIGRDPVHREKISTRARRARSAVTRVTWARHIPGLSLLRIAIAHRPHAPDSRPPQRHRPSDRRRLAVRRRPSPRAASSARRAAARRVRSCTPSGWRSPNRRPASGWSSRAAARTTCARRSRRRAEAARRARRRHGTTEDEERRRRRTATTEAAARIDLRGADLHARGRSRAAALGPHRRHGDRASSRIGRPAADAVGADEIILIRQYRYTIDRWIWELPAGSLKPGENPDAGRRARMRGRDRLVPGPRRATARRSIPTPGFCDEEMIFYRCSELRPPDADSTAHKDEDEDLEPRRSRSPRRERCWCAARSSI